MYTWRLGFYREWAVKHLTVFYRYHLKFQIGQEVKDETFDNRRAKVKLLFIQEHINSSIASWAKRLTLSYNMSTDGRDLGRSEEGNPGLQRRHQSGSTRWQCQDNSGEVAWLDLEVDSNLRSMEVCGVLPFGEWHCGRGLCPRSNPGHGISHIHIHGFHGTVGSRDGIHWAVWRTLGWMKITAELEELNSWNSRNITITKQKIDIFVKKFGILFANEVNKLLTWNTYES